MDAILSATETFTLDRQMHLWISFYSLDIIEYYWISLDIIEYHWTPLDYWMSLEIIGFIGYPWTSLNILGYISIHPSQDPGMRYLAKTVQKDIRQDELVKTRQNSYEWY